MSLDNPFSFEWKWTKQQLGIFFSFHFVNLKVETQKRVWHGRKHTNPSRSTGGVVVLVPPRKSCWIVCFDCIGEPVKMNLNGEFEPLLNRKFWPRNKRIIN